MVDMVLSSCPGAGIGRPASCAADAQAQELPGRGLEFRSRDIYKYWNVSGRSSAIDASPFTIVDRGSERREGRMKMAAQAYRAAVGP
jgi:hypothetical protein